MANYTMVLDTETAGTIDKPFCYDVGYCIIDMNAHTIVERKHFIVEQIWHNLPLFDSAYYADKREEYVLLMRKHLATMDKFGYIMREIARDVKKYGITDCYAYNSDFDDRVITRACDWFKCINPLETVAIHDIWGYACQFITNKKNYKEFCEANERFNDSGNYKQSAEVVYQYITNNPDFVEKHMGLHDSEIEAEILMYCIDNGANWATDYDVVRILKRIEAKPFVIKVDKKVVYSGTYIKKYVRDNTYYFTSP